MNPLAIPASGAPGLRRPPPGLPHPPDYFQQWREYNTEAKLMPIPDSQTMLLPVLRVVADGHEHSSEEIREHVRVQFEIAPDELLQKLKNGTPVFHNRVAWALAHLNMRRGPLGHSEAIEKVKKEVYKITEYGKAILKRNPSALTIRDL
jgi:restriction system protein